MFEQRLFTLAPEALVLQATYDAGDGWRLRVSMRRQGDHWSEADVETYSHLSTAELADVIAVVALGMLRVS